MKFIRISAFLLFISIFGIFIKTKGQVCPAVFNSRYVSLSEKVVQFAQISSIKGHSVVAIKGGFWLTGTATLANGDIDFFYSKLDDTGKVLLFKTMGLQTREGGFAIKVASTPSGGIIITGSSYENSVSAFMGAVASIDNVGQLKWYRKTAADGNQGVLDAIRGVLVEPNGDVVCIGDAQQYSNLNYSRVLIVKLDSNGNQKFINQINVSVSGNNQQTHPTDIKSTKNGYLIGGWTTSSQNAFLLLVNKTNGASISCFYLPSIYRYSSDHIIVLPSGKVFLFGFTNVNGDNDGFIAAVNFDKKKILWQKGIPIKSNSSDYCAYAILENENLFVSTQTTDLNTGETKQTIIAIDTNGIYKFGNLIYTGSNSFKTANSCSDFDLLLTGGLVFYGQDNATSNVHLNFAIVSPCSSEVCATHKDDFQPYNTNINIVSMNCSDHFIADVTKESPTIIDIPIIRELVCKEIEKTPLDYWLLNSFSPGTDGTNDVFKIGHKGPDFSYNIMIYNRWGELVYETQNASVNDQSKFWNGQVMNDGVDCPAGTYFVIYQLYLDGPSKSAKEIHGSVNLVK